MATNTPWNSGEWNLGTWNGLGVDVTVTIGNEVVGVQARGTQKPGMLTVFLFLTN